jgi:hypothetical protein
MVKNQKNSICGWVQGTVSTSLVWFIGGIGSLLWWCFWSVFLKIQNPKNHDAK